MKNERFNQLVEEKTSVAVIINAAIYEHEYLNENQFKLLHEMAKNEIELLLAKDFSARQLLDQAHLFRSIRFITSSVDIAEDVMESSFKLEFDMQTKILDYIKTNKTAK